MRQAFREKLLPVLLGLVFVAGSFWVQRTQPEPLATWIKRLDQIFFDLRLNLTLSPPAKPDPRIVIVDIDEKSLRAEGQWPWPRQRLAHMVNRLWHYGVPVVAFDMVFGEPEINPARQVLAHLPPDAPESARQAISSVTGTMDGDHAFAQALSGGDSLLGFAFHNEANTPSVGLLPHTFLPLPPAQRRYVIPRETRFAADIPILQRAAASGGFISTDPDSDGVSRRSPLLLRFGDRLYPSLALETVRLLELQDRFTLISQQFGKQQAVEGVRLGAREIPTDELAQVIIPYSGPRRTFRYVSATDVLHGRVPPAIMAGAVALVGSTAAGLMDLRSTPVGKVFPGVEIQANLIRGFMDRSIPFRPEWSGAATLLALLVLGSIIAVLLPFLGPWSMVIVSTGTASLLFGFNIWAWNDLGLALPVAIPGLLLLTLATFNLGYGFLFENRLRERLRDQFGQYVPPQLVQEMARRPKDYGFEGESRVLTVLFADIRGFTTLSEGLDATSLKRLLNRFFTPMTRIIFDHRGTIDKYVGDMVMAFWGAPITDADHRAHAIDAALAMLDTVKELRRTFMDEGLPEIDIGIGLNTGLMNVGDMGSSFRRAYTVIGDSVNLGSRLEGLTKFYGVHLVVSEFTVEGLEDRYVFRELDLVRVKGKKEAVRVYEPIRPRAETTDALSREINSYHQALGLYREGHWDEAHKAFQALREAYPSTPLYQLYLERTERLRLNPPIDGWDGVFERTEK